MKPSDSKDAYTRRGLLEAGAGAAAAGAAVSAGAGAANAQEDVYGGFLADANLFRGSTADRTGADEVTIQVGRGDQGLAFGPPAFVVDPGTTVTWEWTGNGGNHNVVEQESDEPVFDSRNEHEGGDIGEAGFTYEMTFAEDLTGWHPYVCTPHQALGMKGVVVVGVDNVEGELGESEPIELLSTASIFGGAAVGGGVALLGLAAYRNMDDSE